MLGLSWAKLLLKELCEFKGLENVELVEGEEELGSLFCGGHFVQHLKKQIIKHETLCPAADKFLWPVR